jgi:putative hydrolase of the HAD superfamily
VRTELKGIKAIFFDAGGTLIHLDCARLSQLLRDELGCELALDGFSHAQSLAMDTVARLAAEGVGTTDTLKRQFYGTFLPQMGLAQDKLSQAVDCVLRLAEAEMLWRSADASTAPVLRELRRRGFALGIISNADGRLESSFAQAGLTEHFDFFIDSFVVGVEKPDPAIFGFALDQAGIAPHEAAHVGDIYAVDVLGARRAGLLPILYDPAAIHADADCLRIRQLDELLTLFQRTKSLAPL